MLYTDKSCREFLQLLAGSEPVPGGGSVSALVGALGVSLGNMVGSLTVGKKKYAAVEDEIKQSMKEASALQKEFMELVQQDIDVFEPLSKLYGMKAVTEQERAQKDALMEKALKDACRVPLDIMKACGRAIELSRIFALKGSVMAASDAGASAVLCKSALQAASLNVYINVNSMKDKENAARLSDECAGYLEEYIGKADEVFDYVVGKLKRDK